MSKLMTKVRAQWYFHFHNDTEPDFLECQMNTFMQGLEKVYIQQYILIDIMDGFTEPLHRCQVEEDICIYDNYPTRFLGTDINEGNYI